ncbi:hypothetical protein BCR39DRAFT_532496 [Naematelia encephala]|uniref:Uncharacterized protein n=1 Tax=Naematelia encephala TaxID=71784 RepID=A0A1Y2B3F2_9TREE|nr:hypothetical protein BCR39DRAFT_532496 [Naematelia encephala]
MPLEQSTAPSTPRSSSDLGQPSSSPSEPSNLPTESFNPSLRSRNPSLGSDNSSFVPDIPLEERRKLEVQDRWTQMKRICEEYDKIASASKETKLKMRALATTESYLVFDDSAKRPTFEEYIGLMNNMSELNPVPQDTITELGNFVASSMSFPEVLSGIEHKSSISRDMKELVISEESRKNALFDIRLKDYPIDYLKKLCDCVYNTATWCLDSQNTEGQIAQGQDAESQIVDSVDKRREDARSLIHLHKDLERIITFRRMYPHDTPTNQPSHATRTRWDEQATKRREELSRRLLQTVASRIMYDTRATLHNFMQSVRGTFQGNTSQASVI